MNIEIIGIIGLILIVIAWIPELMELIRKKGKGLNVEFVIIYLLGSLALVIYSIQIKSIIFGILNGLIFLMNLIALYYEMGAKK
jgi:MtN3 and saliva related transmembrane protein